MSKLKISLHVQRIAALVLCLCVFAGLFAGCNREGTDTTGPDEGSLVDYTVTVQNKAGTGISDVTVKVFSLESGKKLVAAGKTDGQGSLSFEAMSDLQFSAEISGVSDFYIVEENYPLTGQTTAIVPEVRAMTDEDFNNVRYGLTDPVMDFTVTDVDGTEYTLSSLLETQKAVVLNFWYLKCDPCRMEFPYVQQAYEKYSQDLTLLAMNPLDGTNDEIRSYAENMGLTFPMISCDPAWGQLMDLTHYPTTVVIDRYGYIVLVHRGIVESAEELERVFAYVTSDNYEQDFFRSVADVPAA